MYIYATKQQLKLIFFRVLSHGSCAFTRLYSAFHGSLFSAKLFLTAAFHDPIMQLLKDEEKYLDIDPDKARLR